MDRPKKREQSAAAPLEETKPVRREPDCPLPDAAAGSPRNPDTPPGDNRTATTGAAAGSAEGRADPISDAATDTAGHDARPLGTAAHGDRTLLGGVADPTAVAVGNASLLGIGYLLLGRRGLAAGNVLGTLVLAVVLVGGDAPGWFQLVVVAWWAAVVGHGWHSAGGRGEFRWGRGQKQRLVALAVTVPVLAAVGLLRADAAGIEHRTEQARRDGNCAQASAVQGERWIGDRLGDAAAAARGDDTVRACRLLGGSTTALDRALHATSRTPAPDPANVDALRSGLAGLSAVNARYPGHETMVDTVLDGFLHGLPTPDGCQTSALLDWIAQQRPGSRVTDRAAALLPQIAPAALIACADTMMNARDWPRARDRYQQLLDRYPRDPLAPKARDGVERALGAIELDAVSKLLQPSSPGAQPAYCQTPKSYRGAAPYGSHPPHRALLFGNDADTARFPAEWRARDAADAVLVICARQTVFGAPAQTCPYAYDDGTNGDMTFRQRAIPVRVFELRTARVVFDGTVEMGGASCPDHIRVHTGDTEMYVDSSDSDVRAAFERLINP